MNRHEPPSVRPDGRPIHLSPYNGFNQLTGVAGSDGSATVFGYDGNGNQVRKGVRTGYVTQWTQSQYDGDNRLRSLTMPAGPGRGAVGAVGLDGDGEHVVRDRDGQLVGVEGDRGAGRRSVQLGRALLGAVEHDEPGGGVAEAGVRHAGEGGGREGP